MAVHRPLPDPDDDDDDAAAFAARALPALHADPDAPGMGLGHRLEDAPEAMADAGGEPVLALRLRAGQRGRLAAAGLRGDRDRARDRDRRRGPRPSGGTRRAHLPSPRHDPSAGLGGRSRGRAAGGHGARREPRGACRACDRGAVLALRPSVEDSAS